MRSVKKLFVGLFGLLVAVFSVSFSFSACKSNDAVKNATIEFERTSYELNVMQTFQVDMPIVENLDEYTLVWSSSDTSIATVNDKGYVQSEGELGKCTITATIQEKALSSSVEVSVLYPGEVLPVLTIANLDGDVLNLYQGDTISLKTEVSYLGKTLNCPISYTFSNESVVSLSKNVLTAEQEGKTTVTAYASCFGVSLRKTFEVNVLPDVVALYDRTDIKLVFGEKENDTLSLTGILLNKAFQSGNIENVGFLVENEQIVSMNEGEGRVTLTALKAGETFVVCTYTYEDGIVCVNRVPVSVARERIVFDDSFDVDLSLGDVTLDTITQGRVDESNIKSLFVGNIKTSFADGKVIDELPLGPQTVSVYTDKQEYIFNEVFCTKIISTGDDLLNLQKLGGVDPNDARRDYDYSGYFILANNIDLGTSAFAPLYTAQWGGGDPGREPDKKAGFRGVLDGRGYTVYNGVVGSGGMFGSISTYGIIKNISYVGTDLSKDAKNRLFACNNFGMLENVYVEIVLPRATYWASAEQPAVPYSGFILGYNTGSNKLTNCVFVIIPKDESVVITKDNRLLSDWTNGGKCEINNVYVISQVTGNASISSNTNYCDAVYYNLSELKDCNYASDLSYFSGFSSDWVLSGEYPQRKMIKLLGSNTLRVGSSALFSLEANFEPNEIVWETSNSCVSVSDMGEVEALSEGETVLTCKVDGISYYITVNVISSDIAVPFSSNPNFNYFYDEQGTIKSIQSTTIDEKEYLTIRSGGQWYFSSSLQGVAPIAGNQMVFFDVYLDFRGFNLEEIDGFRGFELYIGETFETRTRLTILKEGLNSGVTLTADDFNDLLAGEKKLFIIDKWLVVNLSTYPIDISFSDMMICELDYKVQSPRETSMVTVTQTELGWGYTLISNDWNGIFNFSKDSEITDSNIRAVSVSIRTDSDMSKTMPVVKDW